MKGIPLHGGDSSASRPGIRGITLSEKRGPFEVFARVDIMGPDLLVTLWGGAIHIGAIGMAVPRPSLRDRDEQSATSSVFTFPGHKEDVVVKLFSEGLSAGSGKNVVVIAGIHWDALKADDIRQIMGACETLRDRVALEMEKA